MTSLVVGPGSSVVVGASVESVTGASVVVVLSVVGGSSSTALATDPIDNTDAAASAIDPIRERRFPTDARMTVDITGNRVPIVTELQTT